MTPPKTVILDNEAVQALRDPTHRKHRQLMAKIEVVAARNLRRAGAVRLVVPTAVRVEAGWSRTAPGSAIINRLRVQDLPLDTAVADRAAQVRESLRLPVADCHIAAAVAGTASPQVVLTSDTGDIARISRLLGVAVRPVAV